MKNNIFKKLALCGLAVHLLLVILGASYVKISDFVPGGIFIELYQNASGASSSYGFFAPNIGGKSRAVFDIVDASGSKIENMPLMSKAGREAELRLHCLYDEFNVKRSNKDKFRKNLAASLAASVFSQHPEAVLVTLHVQEFWQKSMAEYRQGLRAHWSDYYLARFTKKNENAQ